MTEPQTTKLFRKQVLKTPQGVYEQLAECNRIADCAGQHMTDAIPWCNLNLSAIFGKIRAIDARRGKPYYFDVLMDRETAATFKSFHAKAMWRYWNHMRRYRAWLRKQNL